jgi:hypothetical protein
MIHISFIIMVIIFSDKNRKLYFPTHLLTVMKVCRHLVALKGITYLILSKASQSDIINRLHTRIFIKPINSFHLETFNLKNEDYFGKPDCE